MCKMQAAAVSFATVMGPEHRGTGYERSSPVSGLGSEPTTGYGVGGGSGSNSPGRPAAMARYSVVSAAPGRLPFASRTRMETVSREPETD